MELNFFDTNPVVTIFCLPLGILLEEMPIRDRNLYVSLCIEVLLSDKHWTEPIIEIAIAIITVEIEQTGSVRVPIIATAFTERIVHGWEVRVVTV